MLGFSLFMAFVYIKKKCGMLYPLSCHSPSKFEKSVSMKLRTFQNKHKAAAPIILMLRWPVLPCCKTPQGMILSLCNIPLKWVKPYPVGPNGLKSMCDKWSKTSCFGHAYIIYCISFYFASNLVFFLPRPDQAATEQVKLLTLNSPCSYAGLLQGEWETL